MQRFQRLSLPKASLAVAWLVWAPCLGGGEASSEETKGRRIWNEGSGSAWNVWGFLKARYRYYTNKRAERGLGVLGTSGSAPNV